MVKILLSTIIGIFLQQQVIPQAIGIKFGQIGLDKGLSQSTIYSITQDAQGFMWFGTQDGLNRYDGYSIKVFKHNPNDSNSISDNAVWSLLGDTKGNLLIGTERGGVDRYVLSENRFFHYKHDPNDPNSISENFITSLYEDSNGDIWLGTGNNGLNKYNHKTQTFTRYLIDDDSLLDSKNLRVWSICEDQNKNLWVATTEGLFQIILNQTNENSTKENIVRHLPNKSIKGSISGLNVKTVYIDNRGTLWAGTWGAGLNRFEKNTSTFTQFVQSSSSAASIPSNIITSISEDAKGNLWLATYDSGLVFFDHKSDKYIKFFDDVVITLFKDKSGILWIGTYTDGVKIIDWRKNQFRHYRNDPNNPNSLKGNLVSSILEDSDGELWIGTYGSGLTHFNKNRDRCITYTYDPYEKSSLSDNRITSICQSKDGKIWVGTAGGGVNQFDKGSKKILHLRFNPNKPESISSDQISALYYDLPNDILYIGHFTGGVDKYNCQTKNIERYLPDDKNPNSLPENYVAVIYCGKQSGLWVGTYKGGVCSYLPETNSFQRILPSKEKNRSINNNAVYAIYEDESGILWMGTYGGGLNRYDPKEKKFTYYTESDGLANNAIYGILPDKEGNLWLSTNKGITRFNPSKNNFRNFDVSDGLQSNEFNQGAFFTSITGELFFGGVNGFNSFFPKEIILNDYIPPVYLTSFKIFDEDLLSPIPFTSIKEITLPYSKNFFSFEFVALNFTAPEKNRYAYKLEGFDADYHHVTAMQRYASYTNVDPGRYVLHIKASNNDGVWNEEGYSVAIIITPPFWMTWWFRILFGMVILFIAGSSIRYFVSKKIKARLRKIEQEAALERERLRIARDMHDDLGAKVTQISILTELAKRDISDKNSIAKHIKDISVTANRVIHSLDEIVWAVNPRNDTLGNLIDYLIQHSEKFLSHANIACRLDIPTNIPALAIPFTIRHNLFMIVQEALNNVVKHANATEVKIKINITDSSISVYLNDNGKGFDVNDLSARREIKKGSPRTFSNGLQNMQKRMDDIGGHFEIISTSGKGTEITLEIPMNFKKILIDRNKFSPK